MTDIPPAPARPRHALLVEDEALVSMVAEENLRFLGFEPEAVFTGSEALDRAFIAGVAPVLAVVDVGLPDMRGDDLAAELRRRAPNLKIVLASGYDAQTLRRRFQGDGGVTVLSKPYSEDDLARAIVNLGFAVA